MGKNIIIIGGGISSLSAAAYLSNSGYRVTILEKNKEVGGRARQLIAKGFTFDIGPTFYWMPDVFESHFQFFGKSTEDYYQLDKLNPAYKVFFEGNTSVSIADNFAEIQDTFERIEKGSGQKLAQFIKNAEENYHIAIRDLVYKPGESIWEIVSVQTAKKLGLFIKSIKKQVAEYITYPQLKRILEFPVLFLGGKPSTTPAFYNFMNYADFKLGTWHPRGGMYQVVRAMKKLAEEQGTKIITDIEVQSIEIDNKTVTKVHSTKGDFDCDILVSGADYAHTETLLPKSYRQYSSGYWKKKTFAPSALLFYVGFVKKLKNVNHHTLFFDKEFDSHAYHIYDDKKWPKDPLFYASFPSVTDSSCAPDGQECGIFLIPIAPGIEDSASIRQEYFEILLKRLGDNTHQQILPEDIVFQESYCINDFVNDYHSYKGNAYGLANTLQQTHILRPRIKSSKVNNLYFTGQLTLPGPGVPPSIISGKIVSDMVCKYDTK